MRDRPGTSWLLLKCRNYRVTSTYLWPFKEDVVRFDFEIEQGDEHLIQGVAKAGLRGLVEDQSHGI